MPTPRAPLSLIVFLACAAPASASQLTYSPGPPGFPATISYTADADEDNSLVVTRSGGNLILAESGNKAGVPIVINRTDATTVANCSLSAADSTATCPFASLNAALGNLDDDATTNSSAAGIFLFGIHSISGGAGADTLTATTVPDALTTGPTLDGGADDDTVIGGPAADTLLGGDGSDRIRGGAGDDNIDGNAGNDPELDGQAGGDLVQGGTGLDVLLGGDGDDALRDSDTGGTFDADRYDGGPGTDIAQYDARTAAVTVTLADDPGAAATSGNDGQPGENDAIRQVEDAWGGSGGDSLTGSSGPNQLLGNGGGDTILGGEGNDFITGDAGDDPRVDGEGGVDNVDGGAGNDKVFGGAGDDRSPLGGCTFSITGVYGGTGDDEVDGGAGNDGVCGGSSGLTPGASGTDLLRGGPGSDVLEDMDGSSIGPDRLDGGDGRDIGVWSRPGDVTVTLGDDPGPDALTGNDGVAGEADAARALEGAITGAGNDLVTGSAGDDRISTLAGNDTVDGAGGDDVIGGGEGDDALAGGEGDDDLNGSGGADGLAGGNGDDVLDDGDGAVGETSPDRLDGGPGGDQVRSYQTRQVTVVVDLASGSGGEAGEADLLPGVEHVVGGTGDDTLLGNGDGNELIGGLGNDSIDGRAGSDSLQGDAGNDSVTGGAGLDELRGGRGADTLDGRDGGADQLGCGADVDTAFGDPADGVEADCETVTRATPRPAPTARTVSCTQAKKAKGKGSKRRFTITCSVKPDARNVKATLKKGKRTVAKGTVKSGRVRFLVKKRQKAGRYTVELRISGRTVKFTVRLK